MENISSPKMNDDVFVFISIVGKALFSFSREREKFHSVQRKYHRNEKSEVGLRQVSPGTLKDILTNSLCS